MKRPSAKAMLATDRFDIKFTHVKNVSAVAMWNTNIHEGGGAFAEKCGINKPAKQIPANVTDYGNVCIGCIKLSTAF